MFNENLTCLGLSEKEAMLYLLLLRNGPAPATLLAKRLGIKRVSLYPVLSALLERGLISFEQTKFGRKYLPHDPECLLDFLEEERAELIHRMDLAKSCILQLHEFSVWQKV
ncbi:MAG: helix-turn-helix domain-containing protein [Candidatus Gracilibacteria bacterium]